MQIEAPIPTKYALCILKKVWGEAAIRNGGTCFQGIDATMGDELPVVMIVLFSGYFHNCHDWRLVCCPGTSFAALGESHGEGTRLGRTSQLLEQSGPRADLVKIPIYVCCLFK